MKDIIIKKLKLDKLNSAKYNPRKSLKHGDSEYEKLKKSIQNFGYVELIVVNATNNNTVISGHQRLSVLKELGETEVDCVVVELSEADERALNLAMNKIRGEWDLDKLADLLVELKDFDYDLDLTGFEVPEIESLLSNIHSKDVREDDFDVDKELKSPVFSRSGDLWCLGRHRVLCGDASKEESYRVLMEGRQADLVLTDPPYGVDIEERAGKILNDNLDEDEFYKFLLSAFSCIHKNLAGDGSIYVWYADTKGLIFKRAYRDAGFHLSSCCVWKKNMFTMSYSPYQWIHEPCLFGWKQKGKHRWYSDRKQTTVWEYDKPQKSKEHPTMKPVQLMAYPIRNSTITNNVVFDPFLGSGSTLIACCEMDRICLGMELAPKFVDVIVKRYIEHEGGNSSDVSVVRNGQEIKFSEIAD